MEIYAKKLSLIHWLTELSDLSIINKIENIKNMQISPYQEQSPLSIDDLINRHLQSENDILNNKLLNQDELSKFFENK